MNKMFLKPIETIENKIFVIRGHKVMLDRDLAELYGVENYQLKRQVRRNKYRFPTDFMFMLNNKEIELMVCHFGIPSKIYFGGSRPYVFTEHGILMLSSILNSKRAISVNIQIMRIFARLRHILSSHKKLANQFKELENRVGQHDEQITVVFDAIKKLMQEPVRRSSKRIGFQP